MKKYSITILLLFLFSTVFAATVPNKKIRVTISDFGQTPNSYHYCLDVFVGYDKEKGCGIPVRLGTDFINGYLIGIKGDPSYYIKFAYSKAQPNGQWPSEDKTCQFTLNSDATLSVNITKDGCTITTQPKKSDKKF